jgi:hypothetical protein
MTSSYLLKKRFENQDLYIGDKSLPLGGWEDHYITPGGTHECHPDYIAHPVNGKYGFMICVRKKVDAERYRHVSNEEMNTLNDYYKYSVDMYTPKNKEPRKLQDPYTVDQRRMPNESYLIANDYVRLPFKYNGTGVKLNNTPDYTLKGNKKFSEFGFSYCNDIPYKYDVTRLQQPYPVWKKSKKYIGELSNDDENFLDKKYRDRITS